MSFVYYNTPKGKAYFEKTDTGLKAVADSSIVKKLQSGALQASEESVANTKRFGQETSTQLPALKTTTDTALPQQKPTDITRFSAALNKAIELGRAQRNSSALDYLGGVVPKGSVGAGTFTSLISSVNTIFDKSSDRLHDDAMAAVKSQNESIEKDKQSITELALKALEEGATADQVKLIQKAGSLEDAMGLAATALQDKVKDAQIFSTSKGLVAVTTDKDGNQVAKVIFATPDGGGGGSIDTGGGKVTREELGEVTSILNTERGDDGYTNSGTYEAMYDEWLRNNYGATEFFKQFPPNIWVNPNDPSVPQYIKDQMKTDTTDSSDALIDEAIKKALEQNPS